MGRRRSDIYEAVRRVLNYPLEDRGDYSIVYRHRVEGVGEVLREARLESVARVDKWAVHLVNGDSIPLHRIVEIRGPRGETVWRRGLGWLEDLSSRRRTAD
ncbi:hypothetical protein APE_0939 [Aeropyrum pernix K1]|uniref:UPF0248 protein APE_0939 n=1 Tax=Aeropyrum pernix (strain ATCC 700893 / DSM 11879 / JCM 9820 / NBRC 100138 / K1) TaxID=272557 RepID=Y939_AERPE|nr:DUF504 domain-containing protein [Aeropyrum pernix]Q9YDH4.1 RecName: Full=UPF0248 protein APE_0939 [Aeropyrum pernix K1]BAA79923.1 hypothetical protein APE_0939 [Aeropyrum pernix K1]